MNQIRRAGLVAVAAVLASCSADSPDAGTVREVDAGDVTLHVEVRGPRRPETFTVVVQGGPGLTLAAAAPYRALADDERGVVLYDQRGTGASSAPDAGDYGIDAQVADLDAVRAAVDADEVELIGVSFGGAIAAAYAARHPDRVSALVLVAAVPLDVGEYLAGSERFNARIAVLQDEGLIPDPLPPKVGDSCLPPFEAVIPAYLDDPRDDVTVDIGPCHAASSAVTRRQFIESSSVDELARELPRFTGRALVVMGSSDAFGIEWVDRSVELLTGATVEREVVDDVGHIIVAEQPERLFALVRTFLDDD